MLTHLSLFSGIGGLDLAAEWAGFTTAGQCEFADFPTKILEKHWPDVPRWRNIRTLTKESFYERTGLHTVDVISGGFPCQPFSVAGKQAGKEDDRYLWPEMLRIISELTPRWVIGENVPGILRIAAADVVQDLERAGYNVVLFDFEAAAVGAFHRRERIAFIGEQAGAMENAGGQGLCGAKGCGQRSENVPNAESAKCPRGRTEAWGRWPESGCGRWWAAEPDVGRVANGVPNRVDRLKCLGNAVVPQQFSPIFRAIAEVEGMA